MPDDIMRVIKRFIQPDEWGDAYILAAKVAPKFDPERGASWATYFMNRWRYHKLDLARASGGRTKQWRQGPSNQENLSRRRALQHVAGWHPAMERTQLHRGFALVDAQDEVERALRGMSMTLDRFIVRCLTDGHTHDDIAHSSGYHKTYIGQRRQVIRERLRELRRGAA